MTTFCLQDLDTRDYLAEAIAIYMCESAVPPERMHIIALADQMTKAAAAAAVLRQELTKRGQTVPSLASKRIN